ncbi:dethiobiotin synthase [Antrihabitans stalactiti]|uniref:ATP-dependent dethiobiotin synthetase BioD n=1 Tax=Antrihabitans stalactiti TaxID=2584121 RepID=A0A848KDZ6_9NOCA|nr:dethiobiotin synthase [Antrihabitans stalactiti]NMN94932.1 ATP-dependent dethiobiotin synthetase BioD [Antrihabitans stalactiti]
MILLVTGTSTGVGKTVVTAALAAMTVREFGPQGGQTHARSVAVVKPAQTGVLPGEPGDLEDITRLSGVTSTLELARYPDPLAPDTAARRAGLRPLTLDHVVSSIRDLDADITIVEGAGGLLVRLGEEFTLIDLAHELEAPVLVVAAAGLGTLNHTELTVQALDNAGITCSGLVIGSWPADPDLAARCNLIDLPRVTGVDIVGRIPEGSGALDRAQFLAAAPNWFDPGWLPNAVAKAG